MLEMEPTEAISAAVAVKVPLRIKVNYLEPALLRIPGPEVLINVVRRRVRQLIQGHRALTQTDPRMDFSDIALKEISEGKLSYELDNEEVEAVPEVSQPHDGGTPARF
jgi:DNA-directed RNA polymerase subunit omega